jgi:type VI secretion system secreted protein Hcp
MNTAFLRFLSAAIVLLPFLTVRSAEPIRAMLTVNGAAVPGDGPGGSILILGFEHEVVSPRDAATGQATGARQYKPVRLVKAIDKTTPLLFQALAQNRNCNLELKFYRKDASNQAVHYYTITLTNANVSGIREWKPNIRDLSADRAGDLEEVSFVYHTITFTYVEGGITFEDTWSAAGP